jgi:predicted transcriptional regulator
MSKRTTELLEIIKARLDDDEHLEVESIAMEDLNLISIEVSTDLDEADDYIENVREDLVELLPEGVDLGFSVV